MTPSQWKRVRETFEALVDREPAEARQQLEREVNDDPVVKAEVASLLEHHSRAGSFLDDPPPVDVLVAEDALAPGAMLGSYKVIREIGYGGMGRVFLASDVRLEREVCLKVIRSEVAGKPGYRERLRREARVAASLKHPGICAVYALEESDHFLFVVTEFIEGRTLREEIAGGRRPGADEVFRTMSDLVSALDAAHAKRITHRDLKPENIIRSPDGRPKILDFGLARADQDPTPQESARTMPGTFVGTLGYMSPEQLNGQIADPRSDVFALGMLIYEFATGRHPFEAPTPLATAARILEHNPEPLDVVRPDLPSDLIAVVHRCLEKLPDQRFASAGDVAAALGAKIALPRQSDRRHRRAWWRVHQLAVIALYLAGSVMAWQIKEWEPSPLARWAFLIIGVLAAINGVVRGHLLFTEYTNPQRLAGERQRTRVLTLALDLAIALALFADASLISTSRPVVAVLVMGLAAGIGTAAVFIEPSTSSAAIETP
jgi:serine/threonine protein kinase